MINRGLLCMSASIFWATFALSGCSSSAAGSGDATGTKQDALPQADTGATSSDSGVDDTGGPDDQGVAGDGEVPDGGEIPMDAEADGSTGAMDAMLTDTSSASDGSVSTDAGEDGGGSADALADGSIGDGGGAGDGGSCPANTACSLGASNGLCRNNACSTCVDRTDDTACTTAYGGGTTSYICLNGSCVAGNCHSDADCAGRICGIATANTCGSCSSDTQCQTDPGYGATFACNTVGGTCVPNVCSPAPAICTFSPVANGSNPSDFCCPQTGGALACQPGNCCTNSDCLLAGQTCLGGTCTACTAATGATYYVDPNPAVGRDSGTTGSMTCPFRTITHAISFLGSSLAADATIVVLASTPVSAGETFPIVVPQHIHITGPQAGNVPMVLVPANQTGFVLNAANSGLSRMTIDGQSMAAFGILAVGGSTRSTTIDHLTVENVNGEGISVRNAPGQAAGGILQINGGVVSTNNGTSTNRTSGLQVAGSGHAIVTGVLNASATDQIAFTNNRNHGIVVTGRGYVTITATAGAMGAGNVVLNSNDFAGLWIQQEIGTSRPPQNRVSGVAVWNNGTVTNGANGVHLWAGSSVMLRRSSVLSNRGNGVFVQRTPTVNGFSDDVSRLDLGTVSSFGHNTVQSTFGMNNNARAGVCLELGVNANQTLNAAGNIYSGGRDCSVANPGAITRSMGGCPATGPDIGVSNGSAIDTTFCPQL
jgi:hypothetical protein